MSKLIRGPREGWLTLLLLLTVVLTPIISLADAAWVDDLSIGPWLAFFAVLLGMVLAKLPVRGRIAHLFAVEIGLLIISFYFAAGLPGIDWAEKFWWLGQRIWVWLETAFAGGISNDVMLFALLMAMLAWFLGYVSSWFAFRRQSAWFALAASGSALLMNLSYLPPNSLTYFVVFLLASMLLLIRLTLHQKESDWHHSDAEYNRSLTWNFLWRGALLSVVIVGAAWAAPIASVNAAVAENWSHVTSPWQALQSEFDRLFASVGASTAKAEGNRFTKTLALKGTIELGPDIVLQVASLKPEYWATQAYDRYTGQGWTSSAPETTRLDANDQRLSSTSTYRGRLDLEQRFRVLAGRSTSLFSATSPVKLSLPVNADHFASLDDLSAVRSVTPLRPGQQYAVISSVSVATAAELREAGTAYPEWVARYLLLPEETRAVRGATSLRRVATTTRRVTGGTTNPYDAAVAIESYLREFRYETRVASPPPDRDVVDWFLFTSKEGYCDYFASAMAVMARMAGIPTRVVSGYNTGTFSESTGFFDVRQENAHSWPELFFPEYGWVRFEPTPSQPASVRPDTPLVIPGPADPMNEGDLQALSFESSARDRLLLDDGLDTFGTDYDGSAAGADMVTSRQLVLGIGAAALLMLAVVLFWRGRLSRLSTTEWAYLQMCALAGVFGLKLRPSQTPSEYGRQLSVVSPELQPDVDLVVNRYIEETYRGRTMEPNRDVERSGQRLRVRLPFLLLRRRFSR